MLRKVLQNKEDILVPSPGEHLAHPQQFHVDSTFYAKAYVRSRESERIRSCKENGVVTNSGNHPPAYPPAYLVYPN